MWNQRGLGEISRGDVPLWEALDEGVGVGSLHHTQDTAESTSGPMIFIDILLLFRIYNFNFSKLELFKFYLMSKCSKNSDRISYLGGRLDLVERSLGRAVGDVLSHRATEERRLLVSKTSQGRREGV